MAHCDCLDLSVSSSTWGLGRAAVCGTPWTFLLPLFAIVALPGIFSYLFLPSREKHIKSLLVSVRDTDK